MKAVLLFFVFLVAANGFAQHKAEQKETILFDPAFWREELRLSSDQYQQMQDINNEFYNRLKSAYKEMKEDGTSFRDVFAQCCANRNTQLWQTMNARQKRKWTKITVAEQIHDISQITSFHE